MGTKNLLVELFVEELPPKALKHLGEVFADKILNHLVRAQLAPRASVTGTKAFASPRRLAVFIPEVLVRAADRPAQQKLMPVAVALDAAGNATPALLKKLSALGADAAVVPTLKRQMDGKTEALFFDSIVPGATLAEGLQAALEAALVGLPIPKMMSYQLADGWSSVNFVRPAHRLVALHGAEIVPISVLGLMSGCETQGHRFEAAKPVVAIRDADSYAEQLKTEGAVIAGFAARRAEVERQLKAAAANEGLQPIDDEALLDEVTALVERPNVMTCQFEKEFLDVPQECLILTMKANQKYFPLLDTAGKLTNKFLVVSNINPADPSAVIGGNERVVRPRLADAKFFFDQDRKKSLMDRIPGLAKVVYHNMLGTQGERVERVAALARAVGHKLGGEALANQADRAAVLSKADLLTDMVGEFPELQGIMGRYYALHDGEPVEIADAIEDHYRPRFAGDELPRGTVGLCVALADKLQTLADMFGIGQLPTGDKDPFALRRHALGVIRMLIERDLPLDLAWLFGAAKLVDGRVIGQLTDFIFERLAGSLREQGYSAHEVDAVLGLAPQRLGDIPKRLAAVRTFAALPEAASLAAANKRVGNILKKVSGGVTAKVDPARLKEPAEVALNAALAKVGPIAAAAFEQGDYTASLQSLAALKDPIDDFFDHVMVNVEDEALRTNRLGLLAILHAAMNRVADLSRLSA
ncbi:MAG: glycine--tRNA ligase subunit beta [Rhodocyclaceae bacterium]|nr:glycine--tRNA ligase subunit beta [Rhodocyclaceae bacterium]MBX3675544.1 glycine--tRNA ligase subunit beta [Rhodocyclaceae bacterium]MCB1891557.1 glycine--tRNA ligase subunit beta [Rhodocyclaceae bacterium]MCP5297143.1 glycine--tRNA ligase subunit beta [Zoogloeaceae bacterium]MCW5596634.1 glycine--tRNA ligase subunit beta [Rhodocyclaceae bacterium]